ncbi:MAG: hypothetical protein WCG08_16765, partial [Paludibacter sp.]
METMNTLHKATVKIICGSDRGTAFFISEKHLLTARHNIISYLVNEEDILIEIDNQLVLCSLVEQIENIDFALIEVQGIVVESYLELINRPIEKGHKFHFYGYSNTLVGQASGISLELKIQDYFNIPRSDFDSTALIIDSYQPTIFNGFSGSPIYAAENKVLGIVVKKLDGCIGFVSTLLISEKSEKLKELGINVLENYSDYDENSYSKIANRRLLKKTIELAGQRFERNLHQPNNDFNIKIEQLLNIEEYQKQIRGIENVDKLLKNFLIENDIKLPNYIDFGTQNILQDKSLLNYFLTIDINKPLFDSKDQLLEFDNTAKGKFKKLRLELLNIKHSRYDLNNKLIVKGLAGSGKTHLMCNIAESLINETNVYLCYGTQFNKAENPITQLQKIHEFEDSNFLEKLNVEARKNRI